ncbi:MAG: Uma2 family endonuclease [Lewinella sp.]
MPAPVLTTDRKYSVEEYFELLENSENRYDFHDGDIRMMASGTANHSKIKTDTARVLGNYTLDGPCEPYDSDMAVSIPKWNSYLLPDLSFICNDPSFEDEAQRRLLNPALLIEVISETSEGYDRGEKFWKYRSLDSFREYMLIDSRRYAVECWYKEDEKIWRMDDTFARDESVYLHTLEITLPLEEIYRRVVFD